jgi:hypothetical protein
MSRRPTTSQTTQESPAPGGTRGGAGVVCNTNEYPRVLPVVQRYIEINDLDYMAFHLR